MSVGQNAVINFATVSDLGNGSIKPIVAQGIYRVDRRAPVFQLINNVWRVADGNLTKVGNQTWKQESLLPLPREITVTAAASPGTNVTLTVQTSALVKQYYLLWDQAGDQILSVTADPSSSTQITVQSVTTAIAAGTTLRHIGRNLWEGWDRMTPINREAGFHDEYVSTFGHTIAAETWHRAWTEMYNQQTTPMLTETDTWEMQKDYELSLLFSKARNGTNSGYQDGNTQFGGIREKCLMNNQVYCPGPLTQLQFDQAVRGLVFAGDGSPTALKAIMSCNLASKLSQWAEVDNDSLVRLQRDPSFGVNDKPMVRNSCGEPVEIIPHPLLDQSGVQDEIYLVNMAVSEPKQFGDSIYIDPGMNQGQVTNILQLNGIYNAGSGIRGGMAVKAFGLGVRNLRAFGVIFRNVTSFSRG